MGRREIQALGPISGAALALRLVYAFHHEVDPDEPQHLHVAWAWTQGLTQYRDIFDNHAPLFHLLSAPLAALIGESPRILLDMRLAMLPLYLATLWGTYVLGRLTHSRRAGAWAAVLAGLLPVFFLKSVEYRSDDLWMALWILALVVLLKGPLTWRRGLAAGILFGAAISTSLKTVLLISMLGASALALPIVLGGPRRASSAEAIAGRLAALCAGIVALPIGLAVFFGARHALRPLLSDAVVHNCLPGLGRWSDPGGIALFAPAVLMMLAGSRFIVKGRPPTEGRRDLALLALTSGLYLAALNTIWPLYSQQDLLPFVPLFGVVTVVLILDGWSRLDRPGRGGTRLRVPSPAWILTGIAVLEIACLVRQEPPEVDGMKPETDLLAQVIRLTGPADPVLDLKGQAVFRRRPIHEVMETITRQRILRGFLPERIQERLIESGTCVVAGEIDRFPDRTQRFIEANYLVVGQVRVAGRFLASPPADLAEKAVAGAPVRFAVTIPARYAIITESGAASGALDAEPYRGPRFLAPGEHTFAPASSGQRLAVIWARAIERGFSPFKSSSRN